MAEFRLTDRGREGLRALLDAETLGAAAFVGRAPFGYRAPDSTVDVDLPPEWIEVVPPPPPPEPEPGLWQVGAVTAYRRPEPDRASNHHWSILGPTLSGSAFIGWYQWAAVVAKAGDDPTIRRLAPVPEPIELPPAAALLAEAETLFADVPEPVVGGLANPVAEARARLAALRALIAVGRVLLSAADDAEREQ